MVDYVKQLLEENDVCGELEDFGGSAPMCRKRGIFVTRTHQYEGIP